MCVIDANGSNSEKITDQTHIPPPDWEALIEQVARQIVEERSPQRLLQVRASLYDLLSHCIDSTTIIKTLTWKLIPKTDDALKPEVIKWAAFYEHRCKMGSKQIFHLEAFVAKYMRIYERYVFLVVHAMRECMLTNIVIPWALTTIRVEVIISPKLGVDETCKGTTNPQAVLIGLVNLAFVERSCIMHQRVEDITS